MKLFILLQTQLSEEEFGSLSVDNSLIHGVFSTKEKAEEIDKTIKQEEYVAQYGKGIESCYIEEYILDEQVKY